MRGDSMDSDMTRILQSVTRLEMQTQEMGCDIKDIRRALYGNGREGIHDKVQRHDLYFKIQSAIIGILITLSIYFLEKLL
jgi:hypothetical protein